MQFRYATLLVAALAAVATAAPSELAARNNGDECSTGSIQCCNTTYQSDSQEASSLLGLLGLVVDGLLGPLIGVGCSSTGLINVGGGSSCTQKPICCNNNDFSGLIVIGCSPININL